jgi:predicted transposase YbfD/YdcC
VLPLPNGIPGKDVFRRVLALLRPEAFQACFVNWLQSLRAKAAEPTAGEQPVFAVDGKSARRSHDGANGLGALHAVSVWASDYGLALGQVACAEKSNEITAIPELLRLVDIQGAIITIDAMAQARRYETSEQGHGREELRSYIQMPVPESLRGVGLWKGLKSIGMATLVCTRQGAVTGDTRYFISSLPVGVKRFARAVRSHWSIENSCHWTLDMTFREDESRIREPQIRENFAWLNRFTLSLLKQHPGKESIAMKRRSCGWSDDFLLEVLAGTTS